MQVGTSCCYTDSITEAKKKSGKVTLIGFGTFSVAERKARKGRNPQAGKEIKDIQDIVIGRLTRQLASLGIKVGKLPSKKRVAKKQLAV